MTRQEIFPDGSFNDRTGTGAWAALLRTASGQHAAKASDELELQAVIEAVRLAEGPRTVITDHNGNVRTAQSGKVPGRAAWEELHTPAAGRDIQFAWERRDLSLRQRLAHQLILIEHHLDVVRRADWVIDSGPEGGSAGGELLYEGPPAGLKGCSRSVTAKFI